MVISLKARICKADKRFNINDVIVLAIIELQAALEDLNYMTEESWSNGQGKISLLEVV